MALLSRHRPLPSEVFTPGSPPLEKHNVYVPRLEAEESLQRFLQRHQVPVVFGEYGVGKTSLVLRKLAPEKNDGRLVYIPSLAGLSMPDVFKIVLEHLNYSVTIHSTTSDTVGGEGGFSIKMVKASVAYSGTTSRQNELAVTSPTDLKVIRLIDEESLVIVLDEVHRASDSMRRELVDWIKATRTMTRMGLIIIGTSMEAERLVHPDPGIDRFVKELQVEIMTLEECIEVVERGMGTLGLKIDDDLTRRLAASAAGAPTIIQALCLDASEAAIREHSDTIEERHCLHAVETYLRDNGRRLLGHYMRAVETTGPKRYRKRILHAAAQCEHDYFTMEEIKENVSRALGEDVPATSLSGPLRMLKEDACGRILQDVERVVGSQRIHNLSAFSDPMMKSFIRFMSTVDGTGLMPPEQILASIEDQENS